MPFSWWGCSGTDVNYRRKLEQKMCLAKETPEPIFDLSGCNLSEIPPGVFSMCRVFRKEVLLLQENQLTSLHCGGSFQDLTLIKVLDLHSNKISQIPEEIKHLKNLGVLNLQNNRLRKLPEGLCCLTKLHTLNLGGNKFKSFPPVICKLNFLQVLDISNNPGITSLPPELCLVRTLQTLVLDANNYKDPPADVCAEGTQSIMEYLCLKHGADYVPPSKCLSDLQEKESLEQNSNPLYSPVDDLMENYQLYEQKKLQRRQDLLQYENALRELQATQQQIAAEVLEQRQKMLEDVTQEQDRLQEEINLLQMKKDKERKKLLNSLAELDDHSMKLVDQLLALNEKTRKTEALLEQMEKDRIETEELFSVKQEELEKLRRNEVLVAMQEMLEAEEKQRLIEKQKQEGIHKLGKLNSPMESDDRINEILSNRERDQHLLMANLLEEEDFQRKAFHALQVCHDHRHIQIMQQIKLIEKELASLTSVELKKRDLKLHTDMNKLAERRSTLAELLAQLQEDKEKREEELKQRLREMEAQREEEMKDYWLLQYQKLMDRKPQQIVEMEMALDPTVKDILYQAGAKSYVTLFAMKQVTLDELLSMTEKDLIRLGITNAAVRESILSIILRYRSEIEFKIPEKFPEKKIPEEFPEPEEITPSAPAEEEEGEEAEEQQQLPVPSAPPLETTHKLWFETECVVCLDKKGTSVFIPCGHVCCCWPCAQTINTCPMCRTAITSKFLLTAS